MAKNISKNPIFIGQSQTSPILEDTKLLTIDYSKIKTNHIGVYGKSGSGKTRILTSLLFGTLKDSIITYHNDLSRESDVFLAIDPHNSFIPPLLSLLKDFYGKHSKYSNTSHIQNFMKQSSDPNGHSVYRGHYVEKTLRFNPLASKRVAQDILFLDKLINLNSSALKCVFDFSSFGPKNVDAIETVIRAFLGINSILLNKEPLSPLLSYKDAYDLFSTLKKTGKLPIWINKYMKMFFENPDKKMQALGGIINDQLKLLPINIAANKEYYDTTITKFKDFSGDLGKTFGYGATYAELTLDLEMVFNSSIETRCLLFDLSAFSNSERKVITAFFYNASYFFGNLKDHQKAIGTHFIVCDEFQNFFELKGQKNPLIDLLEKALNEQRKYKIFYFFAQQSVGRELKDLLNNLGCLLIFALPPEQAEIFTDILSYGIAGDEEEIITKKNISNLERGSYFISFDTIEYGLLTVFSKSLNINDPNIRKLLIG